MQSIRTRNSSLIRPLAVGSALPGRDLPGARVDNQRLAELMEETASEFERQGYRADFPRSSPEFPAERIGVLERRVLDAALDVRHLAGVAARAALVRGGVDPERLAVVVVATVTPPGPVPAVAAEVAAELGARPRCVAFDLALGCNGFVAALEVVRRLLVAGAPDDVGLVVGADAMSRVLDTADRSTLAIFGDGAGALLIGAEQGPVTPIELWTDGSAAARIQIRPDLSHRPLLRPCAEGCQSLLRPEHGQRLVVQLDGRRVFRDMLRTLPVRVREYLKSAGTSLDAIDRFAFHQANARLLEGVAEGLGVDADRVLSNISAVGNTTAASIPLLLDDSARAGRLRTGDRVLSVGFGTGYSVGMALLEWQ